MGLRAEQWGRVTGQCCGSDLGLQVPESGGLGTKPGPTHNWLDDLE